MTTASGWYADPARRYRYRFWDGARWTDYAANDTVVERDALEPAPVVGADEKAPALRGLPSAFVGYFAGLALAYSIHSYLESHDYPGGRAIGFILAQCGLWAGLVFACVFVSQERGTGNIFRDFDFRFRKLDVGLGFAGSIGGRMVAMIAASLIPFVFHASRDAKEGPFDLAHGFGAWATLFLVACIGAPLIEELFFRGLMQPRLIALTNEGVGIPLTALLFGAAHMTAWAGPATFVYAFSIAGAGLVLGLIRHQTGRLGTSIWAHFFFNVQAVLAAWLVS
jgi:membrane protease YdiL (CAAX protease family)